MGIMRMYQDYPIDSWDSAISQRFWGIQQPNFAQLHVDSKNRRDLCWLVVSNMAFIFHFIYGIILPIDFHIFQRGRYTTNQYLCCW